MSKFQDIKLTTGETITANVLAKTITAIIVRTVDNNYKMISRNVLANPEDFKFKE